ncbi:hypothetical protein [Burkholderia sp. PAMC 26561]|uniref:hypothetical protein n=1 Tax=Burkholderia sp. PAMC 26561 TaxID=1795043 RepID=UPI0013C42506|nr:hypothetical protein [Burkholderia sp. PAMC 26561]
MLEELVSTGKPSLSDPAIVDALVRHFAERVFETQAAWQLGRPGAREPLMLIEQDARRLGSIVRGHDSAYDATPWNSDDRLGMYFKILFPEKTRHYGDPGVALFMWLACQLMEGAATIERDPAAEDNVKRRLERIVVDVVARLLREKH